MQVVMMQMNLQATTPLEVRDQLEAIIKVNMEVLEATVKDHNQFFENTMEMWASL